MSLEVCLVRTVFGREGMSVTRNVGVLVGMSSCEASWHTNALAEGNLGVINALLAAA